MNSKSVKDHQGSGSLTAVAPDVSGWRSIESAPKDGKEILLCVTDGHRCYCDVGLWSYANTDAGFQSASGWFWDFSMSPTHWMPLPPPPSVSPAAPAATAQITPSAVSPAADLPELLP